MSGIIGKQMSGAQPAPQQATGGQMPPDDSPDLQADSSPEYQQAMAFANQVLYKQGAARDIAKALRSAPDAPEAMCNTAYDIVTQIGERMQGALPEELIPTLAIDILGETADIAEAAGIKVGGAEVARATQMMLRRFAAETGMGGPELDQALSAIDAGKAGDVLAADAAGQQQRGA